MRDLSAPDRCTLSTRGRSSTTTHTLQRGSVAPHDGSPAAESSSRICAACPCSSRVSKNSRRTSPFAPSSECLWRIAVTAGRLSGLGGSEVADSAVSCSPACWDVAYWKGPVPLSHLTTEYRPPSSTLVTVPAHGFPGGCTFWSFPRLDTITRCPSTGRTSSPSRISRSVPRRHSTFFRRPVIGSSPFVSALIPVCGRERSVCAVPTRDPGRDTSHA
mmetsp:Transcript_72049/g.165066  ORF Transcript_72049/g.165066 Transcript_72049/m.165066 type:complete len:217 (-) Transcript_72049:279-929(-)